MGICEAGVLTLQFCGGHELVVVDEFCLAKKSARLSEYEWPVAVFLSKCCPDGIRSSKKHIPFHKGASTHTHSLRTTVKKEGALPESALF